MLIWRPLNHEFVWCFPAVDFSIMVLSSGAWPFSQGPPFALPLEVRVHVIQLKYSSASAVIHAGSQCVMLCSTCELTKISQSIRESVDSLCRDCADAQYMQYLSKMVLCSPKHMESITWEYVHEVTDHKQLCSCSCIAYKYHMCYEED